MRVDERALAKRLGQTIAKRRAMCGLTQEDLAELRIPVQAGQRFQPKLDSDSKASWTPIPAQPGQPKVIT